MVTTMLQTLAAALVLAPTCLCQLSHEGGSFDLSTTKSSGTKWETITMKSHSEVDNTNPDTEYPANTNTVWSFTLGDDCYMANFRCIYFDLTNSSGCADDYVEVTTLSGVSTRYCNSNASDEELAAMTLFLKENYTVTFVSNAGMDGNYGFTCRSKCRNPQDPITWPEAFCDTFDTLDTSTWEHLVTSWRGGNNEFQWYSPYTNNSYVQDGYLHIMPTLTEDHGFDLTGSNDDLRALGCTDEMNYNNVGCELFVLSSEGIKNPVVSARLRTKGIEDITYGRVIVSAKLPKGDWLQPAIWMLPTVDSYGPWPVSGEINIMESKGNADLKCGGVDNGRQRVDHSINVGFERDNQYKLNWDNYHDGPDDFSDSFHTYGVTWTPDGFTFELDGVETANYIVPDGGFYDVGAFTGANPWAMGTKIAPFDVSFFFKFSVAVGGNYFQDGCVNTPNAQPWSGRYSDGVMAAFWADKDNWLPTWTQPFMIDSIKAYSMPTA